MSNFNHLPVYNLKAVLRETGLKAELLRAWERRYQMPQPQRTAGGHRLYSDYDIAMVKWLHSRQSEGLSISSAVELWREISSSGRDPLDDFLTASQPQEIKTGGSVNQIDILREEWIKACRAFDPVYAGMILNRGFSLYPVETVCHAVLQKGLSEIGDLWYQGKFTVQQEHFASNLAVRQLETLIAATPGPTRDQTILVGCPAGEWHIFPALMLNLLLRRKGYRVIYLGADVPEVQLEQTAAQINPSLIVLSAQRLTTAASLRRAAEIVQKMNIPVVYGGLVFNRIPQLRTRIPAFFIGEDLNFATTRIEQILTNHETVLPGSDPALLTETILHFRSKIPFIEARVLGQAEKAGLAQDISCDVNAFFSTGLLAALELGDPSYLEIDLGWVRQLLIERRVQTARLTDYLIAYREAVNLEMGSHGLPITKWVNSYLEQTNLQ